MKKIIKKSYLLVCAFALFLPSKAYSVMVLDSIVSYYSDNSPKGKTEYRYDENGFKSAIIVSIYKNGSWKEQEKNEYINDENGNVISDVAYGAVVSGGDIYLSGKKEYVYDSQGRIDTMKSYNKNGDSWNLSYIRDYSYYDNGNIIWTIDYSYKNNAFVMGSKIEYFYQGSLLTSQICFGNNGNVAVDYRWKYEYSYDVYGNQIRSRYYTYTNSKWVLKTTIDYEYDEYNNLYCQTQTSDYINNKVYYTYDADNRVVSEEQYSYNSYYSEWRFSATAIYYYHDSEQVITSVMQTNEESQRPIKFCYEGQIYLKCHDRTYNIQGQQVK